MTGRCYMVTAMDDATLAELEHENFIASGALAVGQVPGALVRHDDGVAVVLSGLPLLLFNQILLERADATPGAIGAAVAAARARDHRFVVDLRVGTDDAHVRTVTSLGLVPLDDGPWIPGMAMFPITDDDGAERGPDPALDIRRMVDQVGIDDHLAAAAGGFEMSLESIRPIITPRLVASPDVALYVGYLDGAPVVSGLGIRTGRTIGVYNIATVPDARRRGFGKAMTARVVADGAAAGCDVAVLQASDMGKPIYERMGFRTVVEYVGYVEPTPEPTPEG